MIFEVILFVFVSWLIWKFIEDSVASRDPRWSNNPKDWPDLKEHLKIDKEKK